MYNIGHGFLKILKFTTLLYKELINLFLPKKHRVRAKSEFNKILSIGLTPKLLVNSLNVIFPNANEIIANINSNINSKIIANILTKIVLTNVLSILFFSKLNCNKTKNAKLIIGFKLF